MRHLWLVISMCVVPAVAAAESPKLSPEAQRHFDAGEKAFKAHDFATASGEFEVTYNLALEPAMLFAWAQAERLGGHCPKAIELYDRFLNTDNRSEASVNLARSNLKECQNTTPTPPPAQPPPEKPPGSTAWYLNPIGGGLVLSGVVGITIGITYFVKAGNNADFAGHAPNLEAHDAALADATHERRVGGTALVIGLALAGAGAVVYVTHHRDHRTDAVVATDGRSVFVGARF